MATNHANNNAAGKSERFSVLTDEEKFALYMLAYFDEGNSWSIYHFDHLV